MYYNYVLQSLKDGNLYTGYTNDLKKRINTHNKGLNKYTKKYMPWKLIYYEASLNEADARRREGYLKTSKGRSLMKRRLKEYLYESRRI